MEIGAGPGPRPHREVQKAGAGRWEGSVPGTVPSGHGGAGLCLTCPLAEQTLPDQGFEARGTRTLLSTASPEALPPEP